jgi:mannitol-specific phosphotransferase system IIBC component
MTKQAILAASMTGAFCAVFAFVIAAFGMLFASWPGAILAFLSGFCGSLFASFVLGRRQK